MKLCEIHRAPLGHAETIIKGADPIVLYVRYSDFAQLMIPFTLRRKMTHDHWNTFGRWICWCVRVYVVRWRRIDGRWTRLYSFEHEIHDEARGAVRVLDGPLHP